MTRSKFVEALERQKYKVTERKLSGGFVNDVRLITATRGDEVIEYVLKTYKSEREVNDTLRGYDKIVGKIKTPAIVYREGKEIAYDLIKGKSIGQMITENDPEAPKAIELLAKELQKLHRSKYAPARFRKGNSPDERKMLRHVSKSLEAGNITREESNKLVRKIRQYIPKNKSIIHGDAHLGNFIYSGGEVYFIDPDNIKISDLNADIGNVVHTIEALADKGAISHSNAKQLKNLFLSAYDGESPEAINIYRMRTPLIQLKSRRVPFSKKIRNLLGGLELKIASTIITIALLWAAVANFQGINGFVTENSASSGIIVTGLILILFIISIYFFLKRKNASANSRKRKPLVNFIKTHS